MAAVFCLSPLADGPFLATAATSTTTYAAPDYFYSENFYTDIGVVDYNEYLVELQKTSPLKKVTVAVIDSGLDNTCHPVFDGRVDTANARNFNLTDGRESDAWNDDESGHGTHVAGIIAAGSMANVQILPLRVFVGTDNTITFNAFSSAINYVCQMAKQLNIVAANLSLGTKGISEDQADFKTEWRDNLLSYSPYINRLRDAGVLPVVAAGNVNTKAGEVASKSYYAFPAACAGSLAVSAYYIDPYTQVKHLANFSYHNDCISLSAPGWQIWSACCQAAAPASLAGLKPDKDGLYQYDGHYLSYRGTNDDGTPLFHLRLQGTSMATPFVTLCYALICSDPTKATADALGVTWNAKVDTVAPFNYLNPQHKALLLNATDLYLADEAGKTDTNFGYGGVNVSAFANDQMATQTSKTTEDVLAPSLPAYEDYVLPASDEIKNWANVFWVLCGIIVVTVLINFINGRISNRRKRHERE